VNDTITIFATSSNGGLTYSITGPTGTYTSNDEFTGVSPGNYEVYVKDAGTCVTAYVSNPLVIVKPSNSLVVASVVTDAKCNGADNGTIDLFPTGGWGSYTYHWSTGATTEVISGLPAAIYSATVTDARGCTVTLSDTVLAPNVLKDSIHTIEPSCTGAPDGTAIAEVQGGTPPYSYLWSNFATTATIDSLPGGTYSVIVRDSNGCSVTNSVEIIGLVNTLTDNLVAVPNLVVAGETVDLAANASGGKLPYSYAWTPVDSLLFDSCGGVSTKCGNPRSTPYSSQDYSVTITDSAGCTVTSTVHVTVTQTPSVFTPTAFTPNGDGINDNFTFDILGATSVNVQIWNRWGEEVYSINNVTNGTPTWDGTYGGQPAQTDTYTYQLQVTYTTGKTATIAGTLVLMR